MTPLTESSYGRTLMLDANATSGDALTVMESPSETCEKKGVGGGGGRDG